MGTPHGIILNVLWVWVVSYHFHVAVYQNPPKFPSAKCFPCTARKSLSRMSSNTRFRNTGNSQLESFASVEKPVTNPPQVTTDLATCTHSSVTYAIADPRAIVSSEIAHNPEPAACGKAPLVHTARNILRSTATDVAAIRLSKIA